MLLYVGTRRERAWMRLTPLRDVSRTFSIRLFSFSAAFVWSLPLVALIRWVAICSRGARSFALSECVTFGPLIFTFRSALSERSCPYRLDAYVPDSRSF